MPFIHTYETLNYDKFMELIKREKFLSRCVDFKDIRLINTNYQKNMIRFPINKNSIYFQNETELSFPIERYHRGDSGRGGTGTGILGLFKGHIKPFSLGQTVYDPLSSWCSSSYDRNLNRENGVNWETIFRERIHISPLVLSAEDHDKNYVPLHLISKTFKNGMYNINFPRVRLLTLSGKTSEDLNVVFKDKNSENGSNFDLQLIITKNLYEPMGEKNNEPFYDTSPLEDKEIMLVSREDKSLLCNFLYEWQKDAILNYYKIIYPPENLMGGRKNKISYRKRKTTYKRKKQKKTTNKKINKN